MPNEPPFVHLPAPGDRIAVRVTPKASRNRIIPPDNNGLIRIYVTAVPEGGKATKAAQKLLAKAIGVAPSRLRLLRGATSREKVFEILRT